MVEVKVSPRRPRILRLDHSIDFLDDLSRCIRRTEEIRATGGRMASRGSVHMSLPPHLADRVDCNQDIVVKLLR